MQSHEATFDMEQNITFIKLGEFGTGTIEPKEYQQERLEELTRRVGSGEFHRETNATSLCKCIDGRRCTNSVEGLNSAGGSLSYVVADDLTTQRFVGEDFTTSIDNTFEVLRGQGQKIGVHCESHAGGEKSGCGADDRLSEIYAKIVSDETTVRTLAEQILDESIDDETHQMIVANAATRSDFGTGSDNYDTMCRDGAESEILEGEHNEVIAIINRSAGRTLNRDALAAEFGDEYEAFNVDAAGFMDAAKTISVTEREAYQKCVALAYYNLAAAGVLCGPGMRVAVLS